MQYAIGVDLGGTGIKFGIIDQSGTVIKEGIKPTRIKGPYFHFVKENVRDCILELIQFAHDHNLVIKGIGVGAAGIIYDGLVLGCGANLPEIEGFPLGSWLEQEIKSLVLVENDANVMAIAEHSFGTAKGLSDAVFLTVGTGIGGALLLNGSFYSGYRNRGTEMGHIGIDVFGPPCTCGANGCLEALASVEALIESYLKEKSMSKAKSNHIDGKFITNQYLLGEPEAIKIMSEHFNYMAAGVATLINIFAPQKVIIGGGITESGDFYIKEIAGKALVRAMKEPAEFTLVEAAVLGNRAGFLGAASMVFRERISQA